MPVHVDEITSQVDVQPEVEQAPSSGGAPEAATVARLLLAVRARLAAIEARTRAERFDD